MSRMGHRPIDLPDDVDASMNGNTFHAEGPEGSLEQDITSGISVDVQDDQVVLSRQDDSKEQRSQHGLMRTLVKNVIEGVHEGFTKTLELNGLGYRVNKQGSTLTIELGYSNPITVEVPDEVTVEVPDDTTIKVSGIDKEEVGQFAAQLRKYRDPDPYNQKGIKYEDETIRQKVGKAVGGGEGPEGEGANGGAGV
jgi:large subunit ribosomal protein L6